MTDLPEHPRDAVPEDHPDRWYWASALFKGVIVGATRRRHTWQQIVFLVRASDGEAAVELAEKIARAEEHEHEVSSGKRLRWTFQRVEKIESLFDAKIGNGTQVYWRFFDRMDPPVVPSE